MRIFPLVALAVILSLAPSGIAAQSDAPPQVDWKELRDLAEGKRATVRLADGSSLEVRRLRFDAGSAVLDDRRVGCADIASVATQRKSRWVMWTLLGAAGGAAAGAILSTRFSNPVDPLQQRGQRCGRRLGDCGLGRRRGRRRRFGGRIVRVAGASLDAGRLRWSAIDGGGIAFRPLRARKPATSML